MSDLKRKVGTSGKGGFAGLRVEVRRVEGCGLRERGGYEGLRVEYKGFEG